MAGEHPLFVNSQPLARGQLTSWDLPAYTLLPSAKKRALRNPSHKSQQMQAGLIVTRGLQQENNAALEG